MYPIFGPSHLRRGMEVLRLRRKSPLANVQTRRRAIYGDFSRLILTPWMAHRMADEFEKADDELDVGIALSHLRFRLDG